ncbi:hypothetical protein OK17_20245 [Gordonia sp. GN26]
MVELGRGAIIAFGRSTHNLGVGVFDRPVWGIGVVGVVHARFGPHGEQHRDPGEQFGGQVGDHLGGAVDTLAVDRQVAATCAVGVVGECAVRIEVSQ